MKIIFIRHVETEENQRKITMGQKIEGTLTGQGIWQAKRAAQYLANSSAKYIYTSDLKRAYETAQIIKEQQPKAELITSPLIRERSLGIFEGRPNSAWKRAMRNSKKPFDLYRPFKGESYQQVQKRTLEFLEMLLQCHKNDNLIVISHTGTLTALYLYALNLPWTEESYANVKPSNAAITVCETTALEEINILKLNITDFLTKDSSNITIEGWG